MAEDDIKITKAHRLKIFHIFYIYILALCHLPNTHEIDKLNKDIIVKLRKHQNTRRFKGKLYTLTRTSN